ncbi:MAG: hypothetical protein A3E88_08185 [Legionellales bacterium RIFCSPHIGHO2_12_FULL_35_11]|nr:MAG: hypothetical protein A3E88_08185 [Legionellales bacterium RIFCSPHIGHO2_12_FULL_35_11]
MVLEKILVPDIGGVDGVDVIELLVKPGDKIEKDTPLVTLESDKATMEIPSPAVGEVLSLEIKLGDKVSEGDLILTYSPANGAAKPSAATPVAKDEPKISEQKPDNKSQEIIKEIPQPKETAEPIRQDVSLKDSAVIENNELISAGPAARRLAHKLGVSLAEISGSGRKSRISKEDVEEFVKNKLANSAISISSALPVAKQVDFSKFGDIEKKTLNKIKRLTGTGLHYAWITIPHVTQFERADITDLEEFRKSMQQQAKEQGYKLTILAFVCKIVTRALQEFPQFNSSLDATGENLIYKKYFNIGIAVETPNGLVVPVIKGVDKLSVSEIAREMARLSSKARETGLMPGDMAGGSFTISSLGGIGGTAFTPIINSPEVAILGLSKSTIEPVYKDGNFVPRLLLPLSFSYDHRVIDGAEAARFTKYIADVLSDLRRVLL